MKRFILAVIFLLAPVQAFAQFVDGNKLHGYCGVLDAKPLALAYVIGAYETFNFIQAMAAENSSPSAFGICLLENVTGDQLTDILCLGLEKNPQERHQAGSFLVWKYLHEAFPCKSK